MQKFIILRLRNFKNFSQYDKIQNFIDQRHQLLNKKARRQQFLSKI